MNKLNVITPYDLPFQALLQPPPLFSDGGQVVLQVELLNAATEYDVDRVSEQVVAFCVLARTGALGGEMIPPWLSSIGYDSEPIIKDNTVRWILEECLLDERAAVVLVHLIMSLSNELPIVILKLFKLENDRKLELIGFESALDSPYPSMWSPLPFIVRVEDEVGSTVSVRVEFNTPLTLDEKEEIQDDLLTWAGTTICGAYAVEPEPPSKCGLQPELTVEVFDNELNWAIDKFRAHPDALNGLINIFVAIDKNVSQISTVFIE